METIFSKRGGGKGISHAKSAKVAKGGQTREFEPQMVRMGTKMENWGKNLQPRMDANGREFGSAASRSQGNLTTDGTSSFALASADRDLHRWDAGTQVPQIQPRNTLIMWT